MRYLILYLFFLYSSPSRAQTGKADSLKKIIAPVLMVTGFPAEERMSAVPFTKLYHDEILPSIDFHEIPSLLTNIPSVFTFSQSGLEFGYPSINIRGFDQRRQSIMVNGIPQNDPEDHSVYWIDMPDLSANTSEIEVQRGAGSAFYGPPAIGGSINVITGLSGKREFNVSAGYGSYNTSKLGITLNSGLLDEKYIVYARLSQMKTNGYRNSSFIDMKSYRVSLARFDSNFTFQINLYGGPIKDGLYYYGIGTAYDSLSTHLTDPILRRTNYSETFTYERRPQEHEEFSQPHYELITSWNIDRLTTLFNTLFYVQGDGLFDYDGSWIYPYPHSDYYRVTPEYGLRYNFTGLTDTLLGSELTRGYVGNRQFGWLPRIEYQHGSGLLTLGSEIRIHRSSHWGQLLSAVKMPVGLPGDYHFYDYKGGKDIFSGYISERYSMTKGVTASASIQLLSQQYRFFDEKPFFMDSANALLHGLAPGFGSYTFSVPLFFVNPRVGLNVNVNDFVSVFGSVSLTSREPRLKDYYNAEFFSLPHFSRRSDGSFNFSDPLVKPERLLDLEIGTRLAKYLLDDNILFAGGVTGYYMAFSDELLETGKTDHWGSPVVGNAEKALHFGLELEGAFEFGSIADLKLNLTASHNEIKEFSKYSDSLTVVGKTPIGFPTLIGGISLLLKPISGLNCGFTAKYVGVMFGDIENTTQFSNPAYAVADVMLSYRENNILGMHYVEFRTQVSNVFNKYYTSYVESGAGFFVAAPLHAFGTIEIGL